MNNVILATLTFFFLSQTLFAATFSADDVMKKREAANRINQMTASAKLSTKNKNGEEKIKEFTWWKKLSSDGVHFNTLTRFHVPVEVKNEGLLFLEHPGNQNDVFMYLPVYKKIRRIESSAQSESFMGSTLSYSDISKPHLDDYKYKALREEDGCYVVEATPANSATKERTGYSKTVNWIRKDNYIETRAEFTNLEGKLWKKLMATEIKEIDTKEHKWLAHRLQVDDLLSGRSSIFQFKNVEANKEIPDSYFTQSNLSRE